MSTSANVMTAGTAVLLATSTTAASTPGVGEAGRQPQARGEAGIAVRALGAGRDQVNVGGQVKQCLDVAGGAEPKLLAHQQHQAVAWPGCAYAAGRIAVTTA